MALELSTPVQFVKRIGARVGEKLAERGVETVEDLLYHLPFRYEDRLRPKPLSAYQAGEMASLVGEVRGAALLRTRSAPIFEITVAIAPPDFAAAAGAAGAGVDSEEALGGLLRPPPSATAETVKCLWFHGAYLRDKIKAGQKIAVYGKLEASRSGKSAADAGMPAAPGLPRPVSRFKMVQPTFEILPEAGATGEDAEFTLLEMGRIVPVYRSLGGQTPWGAKLTSRWLRRVLWTVFRELTEAANPVPETLPRALLERLGMPSRLQSLQDLHFPGGGTAVDELMAARTPAHKRLIFEEFFFLELGLELKRRRRRQRPGPAFELGAPVREALKQMLPFKPTAAQKRVLGEIAADLRSPRPMRRLLQGDVGSGKTIVALQAAILAIENGYQVALMAPTEILATQHFLSARKLLTEKRSPRHGRGYRVGLLTGSLDERSRREARARIFRGETDLAIGTHALVEEGVEFPNLGLVIVDEQHRFGVQQRFRLMKKAVATEAEGVARGTLALLPGDSATAAAPKALAEPHTLVMTATPIPRTLALTLYGDLDLSVLDELPPGRTPITTRRLPAARAEEVWQFVRKQVAQGRQAYIVYPVIEGRAEDEPELDFPQEPVAATEVEPVETAKGKGPGAGPKGGKGAAKLKVGAAVAAKAGRQKLRSATEMYEELAAGPLAGLRLGLLHGRMAADDKDVTMARFKRGELDVLVSTTVIEVGVDVPNASVMVIEHAERFGLAQLHQLRGRVGRGAARSFCVLVTGHAVSAEAEQRLEAMVRTQNGFELAEFDLELRGPGEFFGTRQAGLPEFRVANLARDRELLELARKEAERFAEGPDPALRPDEIRAVWDRLKQQWQRRYALLEA